jgi:predicted dehydrogenase
MDVDAAVITTPHHLHAEQASYFLGQGKHVFVEKPLGMTTDQVAGMLASASLGRAVLMVNNYRRLFPAYGRVRELLASGRLGNIQRINIADGTRFAWQSASAFYLRERRARGVLMDRGAHTIDILCWWLGQLPRVVSARSDSIDGIEGLVEVQLTHREATIQLRFSRFDRLANLYSIQCDEATIAGRLFDYARFRLLHDDRVESISSGKSRPHVEYAWQLFRNFIGVVQQREAPLFSAEHVAPSITVIEQAYQQATPFDVPWYDSDPNIAVIRQYRRANG